jgi:hypothetical protein
MASEEVIRKQGECNEREMSQRGQREGKAQTSQTHSKKSWSLRADSASAFACLYAVEAATARAEEEETPPPLGMELVRTASTE